MHHDTPGVGKEILVNVPMELEPQLSTTLAALAEKKARNSWEGMRRQIIEPRPEGKLHINKHSGPKGGYFSVILLEKTPSSFIRWKSFFTHHEEIGKIWYDFSGHSRSQLKIWWFQAALHVATFGVSVSNLEEAIWFGWRKGSIGSTVVFYDFLMAVSLD